MRNWLLLYFFLFFTSGIAGQQPFTRDLWLNDISAPVKVNALVQDATGYQWLGTDMGLFRFNGRAFFQVADSIHRPVTALALMKGNVYAGYVDGSLGIVTGDNVKRIPVRYEQPSSAITSIYNNGGDVLWVCTEEQGIFAVINGIGINCDREKGLSDNFVYSVSAMPGNRILAGTDKGLNELSFSSGRIIVHNFTTAQGLPDNIVRVLKPVAGTTFYWCGTQQGGVAFFCNKSRQVINPVLKTPWQWGQVNDILPIDEHRAWIATEEGYLLEAYRRDSNMLDLKPVYLAGKKIKKLILGKSGIIWAATNAGLSSLTGEYMRYIKLSAPYKLDDMLAMACDKNNMLWFAQEKKLYKLSLDSETKVPQFVIELPANITSLYADKENRLWIGTFGKGLWHKDAAGQLTAVKDIAPLNNESVLDITGTSDRLWVAGLNGVEEIFYPGAYTGKMDLVRQHNKHSGIGSDYIYQLYTDRKERIWMATDGAGVCMYNEGRYTRWDTTAGMKNGVVYSVAEDAGGNIWAATLSNGLYMYDGKTWKWMQPLGVQDKNISTVAANATGQVIVVGDKGIDVWYTRSGLFRNYPRRSFDIDSTSSILKLYAKDKEENVYIPFEDGLIVFRNITSPYDIRPGIDILSVSVFFKPVKMGTASFGYDENHISFRFEGVNFANPDRLHYRYKLEGYNDSWVITNDESVTFPQLPDGDYTLKVQASLSNMFNKASEATYTFTVAKPTWEQPWFIFLLAVVLFGIGFTYIRLREQNLRKLSSLQSERMKFEYEHLKSQVNPHFLFNSLNTLTSLIDEDSEAAMNYTSKLSDLYRNMLSYRDRDLILLSEEWRILENYIFIQKSRFGDALRVKFNVTDELLYTKKIVPLALQLLVENAIKHNIASASRPLDIIIDASENHITVRNTYQPKISKEKGAGLGLVNIKKRYSLLSKKQIIAGIQNNQYIVTLPLL